ncbi:MAG: threonine synthase [Nitrososphaerales archaeon]
MNYVCSRCGHTADITTRKARCNCGGLWQLDTRLPKFDLSRVDSNTWSIFRYRAFLPLEDEQWRDITLGEGMTPVIQLDDDVLLKMDYFMPTLSFKDRGAAVLIAHCKAIGVDAVVQDSSGNAGNSVAAYCARAGIDCEIFVPEGTSPKKIDMIRSHNARVTVVPGTRDHCADVCRAKVETGGKYYANHVYNPFFYQGTKTYIYEVYEQMGRIPGTLFVPLGNGTLFIGIVKGLEELLASGLIESMPHIVAVQSERCDPFVKAVQAGEKHPAHVTPRPTMAEGIAIGVPMRGDEILAYTYKYDIEMVTAPEDRIIEARMALAAKGVYCEHTTAATYAAYLKYCDLNGKTPDCLIPICGAGLKSDH